MNKTITVKQCYDIAGIPPDAEICEILNILTNKNKSFDETYKVITKLIKDQGYSLSIVLKELILKIINNPSIINSMIQVISDLSDLENMVTKSTFGDIYITSLVGIFKK
jgi:hypothetical protein